MEIHRFMALALALAAAILCSGAVQAQSTKKPLPPPQLCIGAKCVTSPGPTPVAGSLKFHPGFYGYFNYAGGVSLGRLGNGHDGKDLQLISGLKPNDNLGGIAIAIMWPTIDTGTTAPNYDWSVIDAYLNAVKLVGKRLWVRVQDAAYGNGVSVANGSSTVPTWLVNKYGAQNVLVNYDPPPRGVSGKRYSATVTNAYLAMFQAMAARYDSDPNFEGVVMFEETAFGIDTSGSAVTVQTPGADYSVDAMFTQLYSLMAGLRSAFTTSNVVMPGNYLFKQSDSPANWMAVIAKVQQYKMVLGGADSWIESWVYPNLPFNGRQDAGPGAVATNPNYNRGLYSDNVYRGWMAGTTDWRGRILFGPDVEVTDTGGYITQSMNPVPTLASIWQVRSSLDKAQYFFFDINYGPTGNYGGPPQQWSTGQYPWVQIAGSTNTTSPYK